MQVQEGLHQLEQVCNLPSFQHGAQVKMSTLHNAPREEAQAVQVHNLNAQGRISNLRSPLPPTLRPCGVLLHCKTTTTTAATCYSHRHFYHHCHRNR